MKTLGRLLAGAVGLCMALSGGVAHASGQRVVYVDSQISRVYSPVQAMNYVDYYSGVNLVWGKCRSGYGCVTIREGRLSNPYWVGVTNFRGNGRWEIKLAYRSRNMTWRQRHNLLIHELGHANGIYRHNPSCRSAMYFSTGCASLRFDAADKRTLANYK